MTAMHDGDLVQNRDHEESGPPFGCFVLRLPLDSLFRLLRELMMMMEEEDERLLRANSKIPKYQRKHHHCGEKNKRRDRGKIRSCPSRPFSCHKRSDGFARIPQPILPLLQSSAITDHSTPGLYNSSIATGMIDTAIWGLLDYPASGMSRMSSALTRAAHREAPYPQLGGSRVAVTADRTRV
jgi:hypothetical protein